MKKLYKNLEDNFFVIAGPCVIESKTHAMFMAKELKKICNSLNVQLIFKSSFDKNSFLNCFLVFVLVTAFKNLSCSILSFSFDS